MAEFILCEEFSEDEEFICRRIPLEEGEDEENIG